MFSLRSRRWFWPILVALTLALAIFVVPMTFDLPNARIQAEETAAHEGQLLPIERRAWLGDRWIYFEVARTPEQKATGLMFRPSLSRDRGMIFPFDPPQPVRFWMRNVSLDLDMLFIRDGQIVAISTDVPPCTTFTCPTYGPDVEVDTVIELLGGTAERFGIAVGDRVDYELLDPERPA